MSSVRSRSPAFASREKLAAHYWPFKFSHYIARTTKRSLQKHFQIQKSAHTNCLSARSIGFPVFVSCRWERRFNTTSIVGRISNRDLDRHPSSFANGFIVELVTRRFESKPPARTPTSYCRLSTTVVVDVGGEYATFSSQAVRSATNLGQRLLKRCMRAQGLRCRQVDILMHNDTIATPTAVRG